MEYSTNGCLDVPASMEYSMKYQSKGCVENTSKGCVENTSPLRYQFQLIPSYAVTVHRAEHIHGQAVVTAEEEESRWKSHGGRVTVGVFSYLERDTINGAQIKAFAAEAEAR